MHTIGKTVSNNQIVTISPDAWRRHCYLIGATGTGKSTLLENLMREIFESGGGFAFFDPHGDTAQRIADATPPHRFNHVVYFDPSDESHCVGFNVLEDVPYNLRPLVAAQIVAAFKAIWGDQSWGPRLENVLLFSLRLLMEERSSTFFDLPEVLTDKDYRKRLLERCRDPYIGRFWNKRFDRWPERYRQEAIEPVLNKVDQFLSPFSIRHVVGQERSTINISHLMNEGKVLIVNLSKGKLGTSPAHLLGALLVTAFAQAAEQRAEIPEEGRREFTLFVDEFQNFATDSFATILSEARKYRLSLVVANQFFSQLPEHLQDAVLGNCGTTSVMRVGAKDALLLANHLGLRNSAALMDTSNYEAWVKVVERGSPGDPRLIRTLPPQRGTGMFEKVQARTRACHARSRERVAATLELRG